MKAPAAGPLPARDRWIVLAGLLGLSALAWLYVARLASAVPGMAMQPEMPQMGGWGAAEAGLAFGMWAAMMAGMMIPTAIPAVLVFAAIYQHQQPAVRPLLSPVSLFVTGYLGAWAGFSLLAAAGQWGLQAASLAGPLADAAPRLGGILLLAAGIFQWTPLKHACLRRCRSPLGFFATDWRDGAGGAAAMGLNFGRYCVGCCWLLMSLLFLTGAMNLLWMAWLTALVLIEKVAPFGEWVSRAAGLALAGWGGWLLLA